MGIVQMLAALREAKKAGLAAIDIPGFIKYLLAHKAQIAVIVKAVLALFGIVTFAAEETPAAVKAECLNCGCSEEDADALSKVKVAA